MNKEMKISEIVNKLINIKDEVFCRYAIENDLLYRKIKEEDYDELILKSIECGESYALKIIEETGTNNVKKMVNELGLMLNELENSPEATRILFASFTTPNKITLMKNPLEKIDSLMKNESEEIKKKFNSEKISDILLAHEMFHFIENKYKASIYTQNKKILLWKFLKFENNSNLRVLSEIAAMSFAKTILEIDYSPFILDILLLYPYDQISSMSLMERVLEIAENYERENRYETA